MKVLKYVLILLSLSVSAEKIDSAYNQLTLIPSRHAVISAPLQGKLIQYSLEEGQSFKSGQLLLKFDDRLEILESQRLHKKINQLKLQLQFSVDQVNKARKLQQRGAVGRSELDKRLFDEQMARLNIDTAEEELAIANHKLSLTRITAPYSGKLKKKLLQEFESARIGEPLFEIISDQKLYGQCYFPVKHFKHIHNGSIVTVKLNGFEDDVRVRVLRKSPVIEAASQTFQVLLVIDNPNGRFRSGMSGIITDIEMKLAEE